MTETTTPTEPVRPARRPLGLIVPLILIAVGALFLLGNLGYLPPISVRAVLSLWPIVLILVGFEVLLGRRQPLLALALQVATVALAIALLAAGPSGLFASTALTTSETVPRDGATSLELSLSGGAGDFTVTGGAAALVEARSSRGRIQVRTERRNGRVEVDIGDGDGVFGAIPFSGQGIDVDVAVASDVPADLRVEAGAGDLRVDLRNVRVTAASIEAGAGDITVVLPDPDGEVVIGIDSGAAEVVIEVPDGVEARVTVEGGAVSLDSANARLAVVERAAQTPGYASATARVTVSVEAGAASVHIR